MLRYAEEQSLLKTATTLCECTYNSLLLPFSDDDYSDTYNATYAVINNGKNLFMYMKN